MCYNNIGSSSSVWKRLPVPRLIIQCCGSGMFIIIKYSDADPDLTFHFDADPDPAFYIDADSDSTLPFNADLDPGARKLTKVN